MMPVRAKPIESKSPARAPMARASGQRQSVSPPRALGNQARLRGLAGQRGFLQAKLTVGAVNDPLEQEADTVAANVMRMPDPSITPGSSPAQVSRKCAECEDQDKQTLRTKRADGQTGEGEAPASVHETLRSPGQSLDAETRAYFEPRFGRDFSAVRVHHDTAASRSARDVGGHAYTVRNDVVFAGGAYAPQSDRGRRLLAHELTHVVQQGHGGDSAVRRETPPAGGAPASAPPVPDAGAPPPAAAPSIACPPTAKVVATSLSQYVELMKCAEAKMGLLPRQMLTVFRKLYYGSEAWSVSSNAVWDDVVKCPTAFADPRPMLGAPLFESLQASQEVAGVDVGHVFVGLEAMMCPTPNVTTKQTVMGIHPSVATPNEDFATWAGDLGAAVSAYSACPGLGAASLTSDDCFHLPATSTLTAFLKESAPDQDIQGDIDAYVLRAQGLGIPCAGSALKAAALPSGPLSSIFQAYYNTPASPLGAAHASNVRCFLEALGAKIDSTGKNIDNWFELRDSLIDRVVEFAEAFYYKTTKSKSATFGVYMADAAHAGPMYNNSKAAVSWFLNQMVAKL